MVNKGWCQRWRYIWIYCRNTDTESDFQTEVDVTIYEGERQCVDGNNLLGDFRITGIERAKRGEPQVDVTFDIDANGMLTLIFEIMNLGNVINIPL